eukprot:scaffold9346_cov67-Attheya_sp.AAC.2
MTLELIGDIPEPLAVEFPIVDVMDDGKAASSEAGTVDTTLASPLDDDDGVVLISSSSSLLSSSPSSSLDEATSDMYYEVDIPVHGLLLN